MLAYQHCRDELLARLREPAPSRVQLLTGPRQVGKTTLLLEIADRFQEQAIYAAGDEPDSALPGFWERRWAEAAARTARGPAVLLLDEVHRFSDWAVRLKGYADHARRRRLPLHVVATGSSALRVTAGSRESLAGRFERLTLNHWPAASLVAGFHLAPAAAALQAVQLGSYPGTSPLQANYARWRAYVLDAIIEPALARDVLALGTVRRPALLRQLFALAANAPAQIVSLQKLQGQLQDRGALETLQHYLALLQDAFLLAPLERYSRQAARRRAAPPKLVIANNALITAIHPDGPPDPRRDPARFGAWVENACLAFAVNQGQRVSYWREEPLEIDGVCEGSWGDWAIEVKTGRVEPFALRALLEFCRRYPRFQPLVVTAPGAEASLRQHGVAAVSWRDFLLEGPPRS